MYKLIVSALSILTLRRPISWIKVVSSFAIITRCLTLVSDMFTPLSNTLVDINTSTSNLLFLMISSKSSLSFLLPVCIKFTVFTPNRSSLNSIPLSLDVTNTSHLNPLSSRLIVSIRSSCVLKLYTSRYE